VQLGLENKKQTKWAIVLGVVAVLALAYGFMPTSSVVGSSAGTGSSAPGGTPAPGRDKSRSGAKGKKARAENLDPTLRLDLLASVEQTQYEGSGRNIFMSEAEPVVIPAPGSSPVTDAGKTPPYVLPPTPTAPPIPLKFFGFSSKVGEQKRVFLSQGDEVFVAGEGEIVNRRYKVVRISPTSVEMQDMVYSGPPQNIPLTQG
jgi:hypothetical protein